jgi:hypothetical protein
VRAKTMKYRIAYVRYFAFHESVTQTKCIASKDPYEQHFGVSSSHLTNSTREAVEKSFWSTSSLSCGRLGSVSQSLPSGSSSMTSNLAPSFVFILLINAIKSDTNCFIKIVNRLRSSFEEKQAKLPQGRKLHNIDFFIANRYHRAQRFARRHTFNITFL